MLFVLNRDFKVLTIASNEAEDTLHYYEDKLHTELLSGVSTFAFRVSKAQEDAQHIQEGNLITTVNGKGKRFLFTIMEIEEDNEEKLVYCEDIGLDLLNETKPPIKANQALPIADYLNEVLSDSGWEIGVNEIPHLSRTLEYTSYANALERLLSICNAFDGAEVDFTVEFDGNTVTKQKVNIYKRRGKDAGIRLQAGVDLLEARRTVTLDNLATALYGVGAEIAQEDENAPKQYVGFAGVAYDDGRYFQSDGYLFDREANKQWSRYRQNGASRGYIVDYYSYDTESPEELLNRTLTQLKERSEPSIVYEVKVNQLDESLEIGDTITIVDSGFTPALYLSARVLGLDESETNPESNEIKLGNYQLLKPSTDAQLIALQQELQAIEKSWSSQNQPILSVESTNGEAFFDDNVNTTLQAKIMRGGIVITPSYANEAFVWTKKDRLGNTVAGWSRTGRNLLISYADVLDKATFICTAGGMQAQTTLFNTLTTVRKTTAPSNPQQGQSWIDTSVTPSVHKIYLSGEWKLVTPVTGEEFTEVKELANTNMQGIASVNTEVGKKVDSTTYNSKVSAIESALANKLEIAVANATKAAQDAEIAKKVAQTAYDAKVSELESTLADKVDTATATATKLAQDAEIAKKVAQTTYNAKVSAIESTLSGKLDTATANATKAAQDIEIAKKVAQTAYDTKVSELDSAISGHTTRIEATETGLLAKASTTEVDALKTRMSTAETSLTTNANEIALKAAQTDLDAVEGRLDTAESSLVVQAGQIASKVSQTTYDSGIATKENSIVKATTAPSHANGKLWLNTSVTPNVLYRSTGSAWVKATPTTAGEVGAYSSADGTTLAGRVTTAETTITQQGNQIALKATQSELDSTNTRLSTAESTLTVQAGQIASKVSQTDFDAVNTRLGTAESTITQQATQIASKVAQTDFDAIEGRMDTAESTITQQATQIASKVATTTYNSGMASKENAIVKATTAPTHVAGLLWLNTSVTPNVLNRSTGSAWVKVTPTTAAEVGAYSSTDGSNLAGRVSTAESTIVQQGNSIALKASQTDLNVLDGRMDTAESTLTVQAGQIASKVSQTDFNAVESRVDSAESTITQQATQIASKVSQSTYDTDINTATTGLKAKMSAAESTITQQATQIASKVSQTDFNAVNTRLGTAESTITQQAGEIASKVATTTYNAGIATKEDSITKSNTAPAHQNGRLWLNTSVTPNVLNRSTGTAWVKVTPTTASEVGAYSSTDGSSLATRVSTAETTITQQGNQIALKATQTDLDAAKSRLTTAEGTLTVHAGQIASKVSQTDFDGVEGRLDTAESTITQQATQIASKVSQTDFNAVNTRLGTAESTITQQATEIASKVATTTYNSGIAAKEDSIVKATTAPAHANGKLWLNTSVTPNVLNRSTGTAWVKVTPTTAAEVGAYSSSAGSSLAGRVTTAESTITQHSTEIASKVSQTEFNTVEGRVDTAESTISQQATQIASKVAQTTYDTKMGALDTAIGTKANASDVSALTTRVTTAESNITQNANAITLRATKTEAQGYATNAVNALAVGGRNFILKDTLNSYSTVTSFDKTNYVTNGTANISSTGNTSGFYFTFAGVKPNTKYVLHYEIQKLSGTLAGIGGHMDTTYAINDFFVDGVDTGYGHSTTKNLANDTTIHSIDVYITTPATVTAADRLYIQPNRNIATAVEVAITNLKLEEGSKATSWTPAIEDTNAIVVDIGGRLATAESAITAEAITNTVMGTTTFNAKLAEYATTEALGNYATTGALEGVQSTAESAKQAIDSLDLTPYIKATQVTQLEDSINTRISQSGGVNILRNSIGWNGIDFWQKAVGDYNVQSIQTPELESMGFGSGWYSPINTHTDYSQIITVPLLGVYTLSFYMKKSAVNLSYSPHHAGMNVIVDGVSNWVGIDGTAANQSKLTNGFELFTYTFEAKNSKSITVRLNIGKAPEATISGIMLNIGSQPLQWSSHGTEVYNTNVRMDINGIQVLGNRDGSKTVITPDEFSGYENGERIFTLNGDTTEVKKLRAEERFDMAPLSIVTIDNATYSGWAFI